MNRRRICHPYLKDDRNSLSENKTNQGGRPPVYGTPFATGFYNSSVFLHSTVPIINPYSRLFVPLSMRGVLNLRGGRGESKNQCRDARVGTRNRSISSSVTSSQNQSFTITNTSREQNTNATGSSCRTTFNNCNVIDYRHGVSQTEKRGNELVPSQVQIGGNQVNADIAKSRSPIQESTSSSGMKYSRDRVQGKPCKYIFEHFHGKGANVDKLGYTERTERQFDDSGTFSRNSFQTCKYGRGRRFLSNSATYTHVGNDPCHRGRGFVSNSATYTHVGNDPCHRDRGFVSNSESLNSHVENESFYKTPRNVQGEMDLFPHKYGISHSDVGVRNTGASRRSPAGFGRGITIKEDKQCVVIDYAMDTKDVVSMKQRCSNTHKHYEVSEKMKSENFCPASQRQSGTSSDFSNPAADTVSSSTTSDRIVPEEPCFISQLKLGRSWHYFQDADQHNGFPFTVVSYNVLADRLLQDNFTLYSECPSWLLDWEYRKRNLMKEILDFRADILSLQEVQEEHYYEWFKPNLQKAGYDGIFKKRTGDKPDGCATFFKANKFDLIQSKEIEYRKSEVPILDRDNIAIITLLKAKICSQPQPSSTRQKDKGDNFGGFLCVANTHLLFNTNRGDIKLLQLSILFAELDQLTYEKSLDIGTQSKILAQEFKPSTDIPIVVCGDFNSQPFSPLYSFVTRGVIQYVGMSRTAISGQNKPKFFYKNSLLLQNDLIPRELQMTDCCQWIRCDDNSASNNESEERGKNLDRLHAAKKSSSLRHGFNLSSVYRHYLRDRQPEVTTWHNLASCTVDYIFYSQAKNRDKSITRGNGHAKLKLTGMLNLLGQNQLGDSVGLPNKFLSSDHFALAASFVLK